jgi:predicted flavoprotein YhiN
MFQVSNTVRRTRTEDGSVLLDIHHGRMFCLNVVGSQIIDLLERGVDAAQIAREVSDSYATDIERVEADVREFIDVLHKHHILQVRAAGLATEQVSPA